MDREATAGPLLVLGAGGQVGHELTRALRGLGAVIALDRTGADLAIPESLRAVVRHHRPSVIVNAAAYTAVDRAESEPDLAQTVNAMSPGVLAEEAEALGACLVQYSTDYVFDGAKHAPYDERDAPNPLSVYGRSKLAGEAAAARKCRRLLILRTGWVMGGHGSNFLKTVLRLAADQESLRVVADQFGAPTSATLIAEVTALVLRAMSSARAGDPRWGVYHLTADGETTWHEYARHVIGRARQLGIPLRATPDSVTAITTAEYPTPARRPANSRLSSDRLRATFGVELPDWRRGVDEVLARVVAEAGQ
jgi:dTDP-4-dehydrorhamnose reductase